MRNLELIQTKKAIAEPLYVLSALDGKFAEDAETKDSYCPTEFKFDRLMIKMVKADHIRWIEKVLDVFSGKKISMPHSELINNHECRLGKWYDTKGREKYGNFKEFLKLDYIHARVHETGNALVNAVKAGRMEEADSYKTELLKYRTIVLETLDDLSFKIKENFIRGNY